MDTTKIIIIGMITEIATLTGKNTIKNIMIVTKIQISTKIKIIKIITTEIIKIAIKMLGLWETGSPLRRKSWGKTTPKL